MFLTGALLPPSYKYKLQSIGSRDQSLLCLQKPGPPFANGEAQPVVVMGVGAVPKITEQSKTGCARNKQKLQACLSIPEQVQLRVEMAKKRKEG